MIIAACCSAGQKKYGVEEGPLYLQSFLQNKGILLNYDIIIDNEKFINYSGYKLLYNYVYDNIDKFIMTIGGDHSIATGSVGAIIDYYNFIKKKIYIIWIDAHADINTYHTSTSNNIHGMPVAFLIGLCEQSIVKLKSNLLPCQIIYIGLRDIDPPEQHFLDTLNIKYYNMIHVKEKGIRNILDEIKLIVGNNDIHVSLDIDGIDPLYCPSTGTSVDNGLSMYDIENIISSFNNNIVSCDIVEFNNNIFSNTEDVELTAENIVNIINLFKINKKKSLEY